MTRRPISSIALPRILILAGVVLAAAFLTQCRMVTDSVVRPAADELGAKGASSCIKACLRAADDARDAENKRHRDAVKACGGDDDDDLKANMKYSRDKSGQGDDRDKRDRPDADKKDDKTKNPCLEAENARHKAALRAIDAQRKECMNGCHHQGGGKGR